MKKRFLIAITALMLFIMLAISVSADTTVSTDSKSCAQGSTVTLNVSVTATADVTSGGVEVIYDKTKLQLVSGSWNTPGAPIINFDKGNGKGAFAFSTPSTVSGKIFTVTFKALDNAAIGDTDVQCKIALRHDATDLPVENSTGKISITCKHNFTKKTLDYPASPASCTSGAKYYYTCNICDAKGTTTFTEGSPTSHSFNKQVATADYLVSSVTCADTADYYYSCECGAKGTETFNGDASWSHDYSDALIVSTAGHWYGCSDCGNKKEYSDHVAENGICAVCKFVLADDQHAHSFDGDLKKDSVGHWSECDCGVKKDLVFHTYGDWMVNGNKKSQTCSACGYVNTTDFTLDDNGKDDAPAIDNSNVGDDAPNVLLVGIISAVSAVAVTLIAVFIVLDICKKKKATFEAVNEEEPVDDAEKESEEN